MAGLGGGLGSQRGELPLMADVNVTSLVDVMLVLLIIFMITAPIMQGGVDVELPRAEARPLSPKEGMVVTVNRNGRIFVDQTPVSYSDFRVTFRSLVATRKPTGVYLQADTRVPYGQVVRVLAVIRPPGCRTWGWWRGGRVAVMVAPTGTPPGRAAGLVGTVVVHAAAVALPLHAGASRQGEPAGVCGRAGRGAGALAEAAAGARGHADSPPEEKPAPVKPQPPKPTKAPPVPTPKPPPQRDATGAAAEDRGAGHAGAG